MVGRPYALQGAHHVRASPPSLKIQFNGKLKVADLSALNAPSYTRPRSFSARRQMQRFRQLVDKKRRADAVQSFLGSVPGIAAGRFVAVGFGAEKPKNSKDTTAPENRWVQVINLGDF